MDLTDLSAIDVRACYTLVNECRELGADYSLWHAHLANGCRTLMQAQVVIASSLMQFGGAGAVGLGVGAGGTGTSRGCAAASRDAAFGGHSASRAIQGRRRAVPAPVSCGTLRSGWASASAERAWSQYVSDVPLEHTPEYARLSGLAAQGTPLFTLRRDEIWDARTWYRSRTFNERHRASGIDDYIISISAVSRPGQSHSLWLHREVGARRFAAREQAMLHLVHDEIGKRVGGELAAADEPLISALPRRQREVLDRLLAGDSEKQAASSLGLSPATVHEYVAAIYRHFACSSRAELMARFIGRARPGAAPAPAAGAPLTAVRPPR